ERALSTSVNLTSQLLTFAKGGRPVKKLIRLQPAIDTAVNFALSGSSTDCDVDIASDLWSIEADEGQLVQVIQNIIMNANEAMAGNGTVKISAENMKIERGVNASMPNGGHYVRLDIHDFGIGIPEQNLGRIFDPYFTTKQRGSGLGLATSFSIIRNHGGLIEVRSEQNKGSTFSIYLPAKDQARTAVEKTISDSSAKKGRILVMDDEELIRDVAKNMMAALGHESECVENGEEAIKMFRHARETETPFDVVILDLTVKGGMGGEETVRRLREIDPDVKTIVSSGYSDDSIIADYQSHGFSAYLKKPYAMESLRTILNSLL
ncbi:MAG TPA: ATP-binding protein, partial [Syntrophales bacterium]|nr:ATP-binding protein [Syntrophales bacterium]